MEIKEFRTYPEGEVKLCEHISINGQTEGNEYFSVCEYTQLLSIECKVCKIKHSVNLLIN